MYVYSTPLLRYGERMCDWQWLFEWPHWFGDTTLVADPNQPTGHRAYKEREKNVSMHVSNFLSKHNECPMPTGPY